MQKQQIQDSPERFVVKTNGSKQLFDREKLIKRVNNLTDGLETEHMRIDAMIDKTVRYAHSGKFRRSFFIQNSTIYQMLTNCFNIRYEHQ